MLEPALDAIVLFAGTRTCCIFSKIKFKDKSERDFADAGYSKVLKKGWKTLSCNIAEHEYALGGCHNVMQKKTKSSLEASLNMVTPLLGTTKCYKKQ